jgi:hypothetical protein
MTRKEELRMSETWLQEYIFLAFRLHRAVETTYGGPFVEDYWGPPAWQKLVEAEPETAAPDLVRQAMALADALPAQGFASNRVAYLGKHLGAMETLARKLCGETFRLAEDAKLSLDIDPTWTPEAQFEQAHALYETMAPGTGSLAERVRAYRQTFAFPQEPFDVLKDVIEQAFAEARKRTRTFIALPEEETIEMQYFVKHMLLPEDTASSYVASSYVASSKHPLYGLHTALTYGNGQKLVRRWLQGPDRLAIFHRLLTEQWTPAQLAGNILPALE